MTLPVFSRPYRLTAYRLFRGTLSSLSPQLTAQIEALRPLMKKSKLYMTAEEYASTALLTSLLTIPFATVLIYFFLTTFYEVEPVIAIVLGLVFSIVAALVTIAVFFIYPAYKVDEIKRDIDLNLPYATTHMATIAGTGVPIYAVFKLVSEFTEYGELAKEYGRISRDIEVFGTDTLTAISQAALDTPSVALRELLWGIVAVIRSGGDLRRYLIEKAQALMESQKNAEERYLDSLSLLAEMYTTIFVAGPILFVVMITIMGSMGNLGIPTDVILAVVVYLIIPVMSAGFMLLVDSSKPIGSV